MKRKYCLLFLVSICLILIPVTASSTFTLQSADTINGTGTTDTKIKDAVDMTALASKYPHYHLTPESLADVSVIKGDGTGILKLYYVRNTNTVTYLYSGITDELPPELPAQQTCSWDKPVTISSNPTLAGYVFGGWTTSDATITSSQFQMPDAPVTLLGVWTPATDTDYKVEYYQQNVSDDSYTLVDSVNGQGTTGALITGAEKSYSGFTMNSASATSITSTVIHSTGDTVLKLYFDRNTNPVKYVYSGDTDETPPIIPSDVTCRFGQVVDLASVPTLAGYDFSGWTTSDATISGSSFSMPDSSVTVHGTWTPSNNTHYVVEYYQQNIADDNYTIVSADTINGTGTTGAVITGASKTYTGFIITPESTASLTSTVIHSTGNTVLKLYYDRKSVNISYKYSGTTSIAAPTLPSEVTKRYGDTVPVESDASLTGYNFSGWVADGTNVSSGSFVVGDSNIVFTGTWTPRTDTVYKVEHYQQNIVDDSYTLSDTDDSTGTTDSTATFSRKTYEGFTNVPDPSIGLSISPLGDTVIKLYYDRKVSNVSYAYSGTTSITPPTSPTTVSHKYGSTVTVSAPMSLTGYNFSGWDKESTFIMPDSDVTITGTWTPKNDTIYKVEHYQQNLVDDNYTIADTDSLTGTTDAVATYTKKIYTGFKDAPDISSVDISPLGDTVLKLYYDRKTAEVSYQYFGTTSTTPPTLPVTVTYKCGASITVEPAVSLTGYNFSGWDKESGFVMPESNIIIAGTWSPKTDTIYKVEHYCKDLTGDGYTLKDTDNLTGTTDASASYTEKSYTGFNAATLASKLIANTASISPDGSLVIKLYYDRKQYQVSYVYDGNTSIEKPSLPSPSTHYYEDEVTVEAPVSLIGYTFSGWITSDVTTTTFAMPDKDVTYTGTWTPKSDTAYVVEYYKEELGAGGYTLADTVDKTGTTDSIVSADEKTYDGYHLDSSVAGSLASSTVKPDGTLVLKMYYSLNACDVTFNANGGTISGTVTDFKAYNNKAYGTLPTVTKDGFKFDGWYSGLDGGTKITDTTICSKSEDHTLYAHWLVIVPDGGTVGGVVVDKDSKPIPNANVSVKAGNNIYLTTVTDATGKFLIDNVTNGTYNLVAEKSGTITTTLITVASDKQDYTLTIPDEKTDSIVVVEAGAPNAVIGGLDDLYKNDSFYTADDKSVVSAGGSVAVTMTVKKTSDSDKTVIDEIKASNPVGTLSFFLSVGVDKSVTPSSGTAVNTTVTELPQRVDIIIPLETNQQGMLNYTVYRNHEGTVNKIEQTPNSDGEYCKLSTDGKSLIISVNKFSIYAVSYTVPSKSSGGGSSSDSGTVTKVTPTTTKLPSDVNNSYWASDEIKYVIDKGYMEVNSKGLFNPSSPINRAETTFAFSGIHHADLSKYKNSGKFKDVKDSTKYASSIAWANSTGYVLGYKNGNFGPSDSLTREQFAVMLYRQYGNGVTGTAWKTSKFNDINLSNSKWSVDGLRWAVSIGILNGTKSGDLQPKAVITRAQAAALLMRLDKANNVK